CLSCFALTLAAYAGSITFAGGIVMLALITAYTVLYYRLERKNAKNYEAPAGTKARPLPAGLLISALGLAGTIYGAELFVQGAVALAQAFGLSEAFIGLTVVAIGTSSPELWVTLMATLRKKNDIALGNIVGSCIFNILFIAGAGSFITTIPVWMWLGRPDLWVMSAATAWLVIALAVNRKIGFWWGAVSVSAYAFYMFHLVSGQIG
ncbi:MAG: sodium:calcium antiporter, partial [Alphaproteobacteria bacterium]|nr:sodium:calcium antiporter [Alphaproteobacteria bacterium]